MTDKTEALIHLMSMLENLELMRDAHAMLAQEPTAFSHKEIAELCDETAGFLTLQLDQMRTMLSDQDLFYEAVNEVTYVLKD